MPLRLPHEYKIRRGSQTIEMVRENPTVIFMKKPQIRVGTDRDGSPIHEDNPDYHYPIHYQDGHFYYQDGTEISKKEVPSYILEQLRKNPPGKAQILSQREIRMTVEEAEKEFGDGGLDSRITARQMQGAADEDAPRRQKPSHKRAAARR